MRPIFSILLWLSFQSILLAQDPATFLFTQQGSFYNPALAGTNGSQAISLAYRQQWLQENDPGYHTALLAYEESLPCSILDFGIIGLWDQEGAGLLKTYEITPQVSANLTLLDSRDHQVNLRLGGGMSIGQQRIDFDKLVFSDQLDFKYGNIFPTNFIAPDDNQQQGYFQPGVGFVFQMVLNKERYHAVIINAGASYHNAYAIGNTQGVGYGKSVLGLLPPASAKWAAHVDFELIPGNALKDFISIKPAFLYERQEGLRYMQLGLDFAFSNVMRVGGYLHVNKWFAAPSSTSWYSINTAFQPYIGKDRIDLYLTYSFNISGLRNAVSPLIEIGIKKHFRSSPVCNLLGKEDEVFYSNKGRCPLYKVSAAHKKLYENVWYKN
jgi:hypothetical protein